ncbi:MAG: GNAT family protein [Gammaproteobacteria bacterium]|nr:GNAT family protein [Gammaproteobacteria bacterium]
MTRINELGQPVGESVPGWHPPPRPPDEPMPGRLCRVERLDPVRHAGDLFEANLQDPSHRNWTYLPYGPFDSLEAYRHWVESKCMNDDPMFHAVVDAESGKAVGVASYLRITPPQGVIEVGHINYSPLLQSRPAATEAMYLMMQRVFELGYRRYEWKCDALNEKSCAAARRLGFTYEGTFRQAAIYKGRNRDTAWFSILDSEWPDMKEAFEKWLAPGNFDDNGRQRKRLSQYRKDTG